MGKQNRPGRGNNPTVQAVNLEGFAALVRGLQSTVSLLEVIARQNAGQSMEDISRTTGISFPIVTQEELEKSIAEEMEAELARLEAEAGEEPGDTADLPGGKVSPEPEDNGELAGQVSIETALD